MCNHVVPGQALIAFERVCGIGMRFDHVANSITLYTDSDYHFTTRESMQKGIDAGAFIEWAEYSGNMYGTRYT